MPRVKTMCYIDASVFALFYQSFAFSYSKVFPLSIDLSTKSNVNAMKEKTRRRRFIQSECNHIYQRTVSGNVLFYDREDYLVFYTIVSVLARKKNVRILSMCLMVNHVHMLLETGTLEQMADFVRDYSSVFVREYNDYVGRHGQLFRKSYGSAPKKGDKSMRSTIVYIGNNPVEKMLCRSAEDYRWNFLRYIMTDNPFSGSFSSKEYSCCLRRSVARVNAAAKAGCYLNYIQLTSMFSSLTACEKEILTDRIISAYFPFDIKRLLGYYSDYEQMVSAMRFTSGHEYDIKEIRYPGSDQIYVDMVSFVRDVLGISPVRSVTAFPYGRKLHLAEALEDNTGATAYEISRFLHLP